ncbi:probable 2-ketogluconate reductase [Erpetoichthys calabaricus]|uniref:probable 2-ketogluconate reductase n=1 Tax=Erpetoichthys calabaricus TaxID=27687 RepID=UPI002234BF01|nr:probable 2-ketogluconate reductase [Erpetoichthys calabaricus]
MEKPHILATKPGEYNGIRQIFAPLLEKHFTVVPYHEFEKNPNRWADKIQALIVFFSIPKISRDLLLSLPNLKAVISGGVGVDHLDIPLITSFGVKIANTPNIVDNATADMGMALLLASARKLIEGYKIDISPDMTKLTHCDLGHDVSGSTLGIIGMGRIGYKIAKRAQGFDMKILYHNRKQREAEDEKAVGATYCAKIEDLLRESDFVMLSVNLSPETHKLIGKRELSLMKPTATLVNVSRGQCQLIFNLQVRGYWMTDPKSATPLLTLLLPAFNLFRVMKDPQQESQQGSVVKHTWKTCKLHTEGSCFS